MNTMIKTIIVDDERHSCEALQILISDCCPQLSLAAVCYSGEQALQQIQSIRPQLVFLDIEMPNMNGFQLLEQLPHIDFEVIFTTSYDQYAIKAIKFSALDYLLKPVDREELRKAVEKVQKSLSDTYSQQLEILLQKVNQPSSLAQRIALPTMQGLELVPINSIISCSSNSNYTEFLLLDKRKILVSRTLKEVEEMLQGYAFMRVHHSYIVNLNEITRYIKGEGGYIIMTDGSTVDVSRSRKEALMQKLQPSKL
jgi:two-component system, LytTR family, response regulator